MYKPCISPIKFLKESYTTASYHYVKQSKKKDGAWSIKLSSPILIFALLDKSTSTVLPKATVKDAIGMGTQPFLPLAIRAGRCESYQLLSTIVTQLLLCQTTSKAKEALRFSSLGVHLVFKLTLIILFGK